MKHDSNESKAAILRQSEERYKSLFQNNHSVMLLIDPVKGNVVDANAAACKYYGWSHEEICRKNMAEINVMPLEEIVAEMQKAGDQKQNYFLFKHLLANGDVRDVEVFSGPVQFGCSNLLYSLVHDVTDRYRVQHELNERMKELKCLYRISEVMGNSMLSVDEVCEKVIRLIPEGFQFPVTAYPFRSSDFLVHLDNDKSRTISERFSRIP